METVFASVRAAAPRNLRGRRVARPERKGQAATSPCATRLSSLTNTDLDGFVGHHISGSAGKSRRSLAAICCGDHLTIRDRPGTRTRRARCCAGAWTRLGRSTGAEPADELCLRAVRRSSSLAPISRDTVDTWTPMRAAMAVKVSPEDPQRRACNALAEGPRGRPGAAAAAGAGWGQGRSVLEIDPC